MPTLQHIRIDYRKNALNIFLTFTFICFTAVIFRARDIGTALNSGAHLTSLRRTRVGDVTVENCISLEQFQNIVNEQEQINSDIA